MFKDWQAAEEKKKKGMSLYKEQKTKGRRIPEEWRAKKCESQERVRERKQSVEGDRLLNLFLPFSPKHFALK